MSSSDPFHSGYPIEEVIEGERKNGMRGKQNLERINIMESGEKNGVWGKNSMN
jgi:hypothetical protein